MILQLTGLFTCLCLPGSCMEDRVCRHVLSHMVGITLCQSGVKVAVVLLG
jgi:hypothetical protein